MESTIEIAGLKALIRETMREVLQRGTPSSVQDADALRQ